MNIEKMKQFMALKNELKSEGVFGFSYHSNAFHVSSGDLKGFDNLQIKKFNGLDFPYEIFVEIDDFKIFSLLKSEQLKDFLQFKSFAKEELLKELVELEKEEEATV